MNYRYGMMYGLVCGLLLSCNVSRAMEPLNLSANGLLRAKSMAEAIAKEREGGNKALQVMVKEYRASYEKKANELKLVEKVKSVKEAECLLREYEKMAE